MVHPRLCVCSYNVLAQGYTQPFANTPAADLAWPVRRARILALLKAFDADVICLQELQSSSRGWGRALSGRDLDGPDHAQQVRLALAAEGFEGAYQCVDDDARSSDCGPRGDVDRRGPPSGASASAGPKRSAASAAAASSWTCDDGPGARLGCAIFWRRAAWERIAERPVLFSTVFMGLTKDLGLTREWHALKGWHVALMVLLRHTGSGAIVLVVCVHLPTPGGFGGDTDSPADDSGSGAPATAAVVAAPKGAVSQVQYTEALIVEAQKLLTSLGLEDKVPIRKFTLRNPLSPSHKQSLTKYFSIYSFNWRFQLNAPRARRQGKH